MPRIKKDVQALCRQHTEGAVKTLVGIMNQPKAPAAARVAAANSIIDRGWGKAMQPIGGDSENPIEIIKRVIIDGSKPEDA